MNDQLIYGSVCSGIEAATVAWHDLGFIPAWFSEIDKFPCEVLKYHYPNVPNLGDMTKIYQHETFKSTTINLLVGGTPCQSFSLAGLRAGLADERGNLALEYCRILIAKRPRWFLWENVPGVLSSYTDEEGQETQTSDFAAILSAFSECGYSCAWRVLDAQFFGVPQRRRRIFVVGYLGNDWRPPAAVLFDGESMCGNIEKGRKKGQDVAGTLDSRTKGGGFQGSDGAMNGHVIPTITQKVYGDNNTSQLIMAHGQPNAEISEDVCPTLNCNHEQPILFPLNQITSKINRSNPKPGDPSCTLTKVGGGL